MALEIFGKSTPLSEAQIALLPIPWDATTSYHSGTNKGPIAIQRASEQIDVFDGEFGDATSLGIHLAPIDPEFEIFNTEARLSKSEINSFSEKINQLSLKLIRSLDNGTRILGVIGGDHSVPFSLIQHLSENTGGELGILHIDAHFDLRKAYLGHTHSHASIMYNTLQLKTPPKSITSVAVRDFCEEEMNLANEDSRIFYFTNSKLKDLEHSGQNWKTICQKIIKTLPQKIYISFDIDGLDPALCPGTGTPVPGGLSFDQMNTLIKETVKSGREIMGFDLVEVSPAENDREWNGNVGMRVLYKLCGWSSVSKGWLSIKEGDHK